MVTMTHRKKSLHPALLAASATLALASTPALAAPAQSPLLPGPIVEQDASPSQSPTSTTTVSPVTATNTSPTPLLPPAAFEDQQPTIVTNPVVQTVPETDTASEPAADGEPVVMEAEQVATTPATSQRAPAPSTTTATAEPVPASGADIAPTQDPLLDEAIVAPASVPEAEQTSVDETSELAAISGLSTTDILAIGGAGLLALILFGLFALSRRPRRKQKMRAAKPRPIYRETPVVKADAMPEPELKSDPEIEPASMPVAAVQPEPTRAEIDEISTARLAKDAESKHYKPLANTGASVPLPAEKPATMEGRTELLDRLTNAKPDRANPFVTYKARRRRARLILQSIGRKFENGSWIDFSQYPLNFPELGQRQAAAA